MRIGLQVSNPHSFDRDYVYVNATLPVGVSRDVQIQHLQDVWEARHPGFSHILVEDFFVTNG